MATSSSLVSSSGALLTVQQFSCSLPDGTELIECSSCSLGAGVFALTGENGSGKSTFLNACGGSAGDLSYDGRIYAAGRRLLIGQQCASPIADELNLRHSLLALQAVADGC
ncbi:MAG: hypothetical protein CMI03_00355 [Oceanospirillaceae bacterium]|nr:hypothetical protein [Thalassolituus sp. UBA6592]MAS24677.1 hypothetical protein [Oceanospirillaceae bacterium]MBL35600.1 hypothetical protein [Oceanospirillaceae bacterium]MBS51197.1 hypothetical protein [Oceanospirillaceae bacterium]|tara:strand:- start:391 stop:723 length:333 start_codon:yes stop_codon:yes gene_type:complete